MKDMNIMDIIEEKIKEIPLKGSKESDFLELGMRLCYAKILEYLTEEELTKIRVIKVDK